MLGLISVYFVVSYITVSLEASELPSFLTQCSRELPINQLSQCIKTQAKIAQPYFVKGVPELGSEPLDPLKLGTISVNAGTFTITSRDTVLHGLEHIEIDDIVWDPNTNKGHLSISGNLTLNSNYDVDGLVLFFQLKSQGKLTVKMYNTVIKYRYKYRLIKDSEGIDHWEVYDLKHTQKFGSGKFILTNLLGGGSTGDSINEAFNENWHALMQDVGPSYVKTIGEKVTSIVNENLYFKIPSSKIM